MDKYLYHPAIIADEGLNGYLLKLASGNKLSSIKALWGGQKLTPEVFIDALDLDQETAKRLLQQREFVGGRPIWNARTSRYCPECLNEYGYWRQAWELSLMSACPRHQCLLIEVCPVCSKKLTWDRRSLLNCACGNDLSYGPSIEAPENELKLANIMMLKLGGSDSDLAHLKALNLKQIHAFILMMGVYNSPKANVALIKQSITSLEKVRTILNQAAQGVLNWPKGFYQMLTNIQIAYGNEQSAKLGKRFGKFYGYLYSHHMGPEFGFLQHSFESYLEKHWHHALAGRNKRLSGRIRNKHIWVPANTLAKDLRVGLKQIVSLIESREIESSQVITTKGRKVVCVNRQQSDHIRGLLKDRVDLKMAATILGIQESRVLQLLNSDQFGKAISAEESGHSRWIISRSMLENILTLGRLLPEWDKSNDIPRNNLAHALRYWLHNDSLLPKLIIAIVKDEIELVAVDKEEIGLKSWVFNTAELKSWIQNQLYLERKGAMTIPQVANYLNIKQEVAYHLVNTALLHTISSEDSTFRLVEQKVLNQFNSDYVLGSQMGKDLKISPKHLAEFLTQEGISPVSGKSIDGGRQNIYEKTDLLEKVLLKYQRAGNSSC